MLIVFHNVTCYIYPYCFVAECGNVGVIVDGDHVQGGGGGGGVGSGGGSGSGSDSGEHMDADTRARELARRKEEARRKRRKKKRTGSSLVSSCFQGTTKIPKITGKYMRKINFGLR